MFTKAHSSFLARLGLVLFLLMGMFAATPVQAVAVIRYVKWDASGANNGTSWTNAYTSLQSALSTATFGDEIWVAAGTYKPTTDTDRTSSFMLKNGISIYGGFVGNESSRDQRDPAVHITILSGDIGILDVSTDNTYHVVTGHSSGSALIDGFTITGGNADSIAFNTNGGGLYKPGSGILDLSNMIFSNNSADDSGGGLFVSSGNLTLDSVTFDQNTASSRGGGFAMTSGNLTVTNASFEGNFADLGGGLYVTGNSQLANVSFKNNTAASNGGGLYTNGNGNLTDVTFSGNHTTEGMGGAIASYMGTLAVTEGTFSNNNAIVNPYFVGGGGEGGAIYTQSTVTVTNSTFDGNQASRGGALSCNTGTITSTNSTYVANSALSDSAGDGGAMFANCHSTIVGNTFASNSAAHYGGALLTDNDSGQTEITNSTFYDNVALSGSGGGIANYGGLSIKNSTFSHNDASSGGAVRNGLGGVLSLRNSILANSIGGVDCIKSDSTPAVENINTLIETTGADLESCGSAFLTSDPVLGGLQDNGGPTKTMALLAGSPAINAGTNSSCPATDQRGVSRPQDDRCDLGAYEAKGPIRVSIGGTEVNSYWVAPAQSKRTSYVGINNGPVKITDVNNDSMLAGERVIYKVNGVNTSFSEMMGLPDSQLDTTYWLPWYNNKDLDTQLRFSNVSGSTATVHVSIGGQPMPGSPFMLLAGESTRQSFAGVNSGPVQIVSDVNLVAAERVIYKVNGVNTSFSEMMALPNSQLDTTYWLPWYNNVDLDTQLRFANTTDQTAMVHVYIGGVEMQDSPFTLAAGESTRKSFPGINDGPVEIVSDVPIVAAERVIYKVNGVNTSFTEMMALPNGQLDTTYWLPWYNNKDLDTQLRFASTTNQTATVHVYIGGVEMPNSPFTLLPGESTRKSFPSVNNGPVQIVSDVPIVAAERVIYKVNGVNTSFSEMMALPNTLLDITYWFPWYNNIDLDTQLRFGVP